MEKECKTGGKCCQGGRFLKFLSAFGIALKCPCKKCKEGGCCKDGASCEKGNCDNCENCEK
jgi:hypothetical protein